MSTMSTPLLHLAGKALVQAQEGYPKTLHGVDVSISSVEEHGFGDELLKIRAHPDLLRELGLALIGIADEARDAQLAHKVRWSVDFYRRIGA